MRYALHPFNRDFHWHEPVASSNAYLSVAQARAFHDDGFVALHDVFTDAEMRALLAHIDPLEAEAEAALRTRPNGRQLISRADEITFRAHLVLASPALANFCRHPRLLAICRDLIGPDVRLYWEQSVYKKPVTAAEFPWHQDNGYTFVEPQQYLTCWIALTEATVANGCPWVVPGLHKLGTLAHEWTEYGYRCLYSGGSHSDAPDGAAIEGAVPIELRPGGIAVFSSLTPHRTGPNATAATRKAYIVQYAPEGAVICRADGSRESADAEGRQFRVLRAGRALEEA